MLYSQALSARLQYYSTGTPIFYHLSQSLCASTACSKGLLPSVQCTPTANTDPQMLAAPLDLASSLPTHRTLPHAHLYSDSNPSFTFSFANKHLHDSSLSMNGTVPNVQLHSGSIPSCFRGSAAAEINCMLLLGVAASRTNNHPEPTPNSSCRAGLGAASEPKGRDYSWQCNQRGITFPPCSWAFSRYHMPLWYARPCRMGGCFPG